MREHVYIYICIYICSKLVWQRRDDYDSKCQVINPQLVQCVFFIQTCRWTITLHFLDLQRCASFCFCFPYVKCNLLLMVPLFPWLKLIDTSNQRGCFVLWIQVYICNHIYIFVPNCYVYFTCIFELRNTYCMWWTCVYLLRFRALGEKSPFALTGPSRYQSMTLAAGCVRKESPLCRKFTSRGVHRCVVGGSSQDVFQTSKSCGLNHQIVLRHGFPPPCVSGRWHQGLYGRDCSSMFIHVSAGAGCVLKWV